jgi:hypothetical protein
MASLPIGLLVAVCLFFSLPLVALRRSRRIHMAADQLQENAQGGGDFVTIHELWPVAVSAKRALHRAVAFGQPSLGEHPHSLPLATAISRSQHHECGAAI